MRAVKAVVSLALVALIIWWIGPAELWRAITSLTPTSVVLAFVALIGVIALFPFRIYVLARHASKQVRLRRTWRQGLAAYCLGTFSPAKLGEAVLLRSLAKQGVSVGASAALLIVDRLSSVAAIAILTVIGAAYVDIGLLAVLAIAAVAVAGLMLSPWGIRWSRRLIPKRIARRLVGFSKALSSYVRSGAVVANLALNVVSLLLRSLVVYVLIPDASFLLIVAINAVVTLTALIPISLSGLGVREASAVYLLAQAGVSADVSAAGYLVASALTYAVTSLIMPFALRAENL